MMLVASLLERASRETGEPVSELLRSRHQRHQARIRYAVMKVARENGRPLRLIGRALKCDHKLVHRGEQQAERQEAVNPRFALLLLQLRVHALGFRIDARLQANDASV